GLDWTADGTDIVFAATSLAGSARLWRVSASGGEPSTLAIGEGAQSVSIARSGGHLAYSLVSSDIDIWRAGGPLAGHRNPPTRFLAATRAEKYPAYSPDGHRVAFQSDRSGHTALWICDDGGSHCTELTAIGRSAGPARWSPDSQWIAYTRPSEPPGNPGIDLVRVDGGIVRTLIDGKQLRSVNP